MSQPLLNHIIQYRVYYEDTDAGGVVYHANYLRFAERARTEWLRELGFNQSRLWEELNMGIVVSRAQVQYKKPARLDNLLRVESQLQSISKARMTMRQIITCDSVVLSEIEVELVCVSSAFKSMAWPEEILAVFTPFLPTPHA